MTLLWQPNLGEKIAIIRS